LIILGRILPHREAENAWPTATIIRVAEREHPDTASGSPAGELELPPALGDGKVIAGKEGRLFLANDANDVLAQHAGRRRLGPQQLDHWRALLEARSAWCERVGAAYLLLVPPNAHSVYPELLPDEVPSATERPVQQLLAHLREHGSYARVVYPLEELLAQRRRRIVYSETASHWAAPGAFAAYAALMREVGKLVPVRELHERSVAFEEDLRAGDLGRKLSPERRSVQVRARVLEPAARLVSDNRVWNRGRHAVFECRAAPETRCLVFGDSFTYALLPFLAESFRRLVLAHLPTIDFGLVLRERPQVVVSVMNERFLIEVPFDLPARSLDAWAREKQAKGLVDPASGKVASPRVWSEEVGRAASAGPSTAPGTGR
jgi:hypothetical protein